MKELQALVAKAVADRGYRQGWTDEQFAARQICKAVEELGELILAVIWQHGHNNPAWYLSLMDAKENAREAFDSFDAGFWSYVDDIDTDEIVAELPDVLIPLLVLAETLDIDLEQAVREKVLGDVSRGVRGEKPKGHICNNCDGIDPDSCPFNPNKWTPLSELREGAIFETQEGAKAMKLRGHSPAVGNPRDIYACAYLATGIILYVGGAVLVREIVL